MSTATATSTTGAPLEDLMVAMDVVDTVRHRELIVDRETDSAGRRERLLERLRKIYAAQGIEVTDAALKAGVDALEAERFRYTPVAGGFSTIMARLYVRRDRWLKPLILVILLSVLVWLVWLYTIGLPQNRVREQLPTSIQATFERINSISSSDTATQRASDLLAQARRAIADEDYAAANTLHEQMRSLFGDLESSYEIRIVSRPNQLSGVWRVPAVNPDARNYYLIVEAVAPNGGITKVHVNNEEDGRTQQVSTWGLRVSEETFQAVAVDKSDDGIIQNNVVGRKETGELDPQYLVPTTGAAIVEW